MFAASFKDEPEATGVGGKDVSMAKIGTLMNWSLQTLRLQCCVSLSYLASHGGVVKKH